MTTKKQQEQSTDVGTTQVKSSVSEGATSPKIQKKRVKSTKSVPKKRVHKREFYMAVNAKGGVPNDLKQLPIFWKASDTKKVASKKQGKSVKVTLSW